MSRSLALLAAVAVAGSLLGACDAAKSVRDKASACADAFSFGDLLPNTDGDKTKREAAEKAKKLKLLADETQDGQVKAALTLLANEYVDVSKKNVDQLSRTTEWATNLANKEQDLRKSCL